jgi:putative ABC transport system substrate-binding protein
MGQRWSSIVVFILVISLTPAGAQEKKSIGKIRIGIIQMISHPALDAAEKGFEKALSDAGFKEGTHVVYDRWNAKGDDAAAEAIARRFRDARPDLVHSIATPASQAAVKVVKNTPIVFSAVTDPIEAGVVPRSSPPGTRTGTNVTGVSDRWPVPLQFEMYMRFVPKARKWGTIYHAGDAQSMGYIREMRESAKRLGVELVEATITKASEAAQAAQFLVGRVQAIHIASDKTAVSAFEAIAKVCNENKTPLFSGDVACASRGAVAAYGLDYFLVGLSAGRRAERILNGQKPGDIPWGLSDTFSLVINEKVGKMQGVIIPPALLKIATKVIEYQSETPQKPPEEPKTGPAEKRDKME